MKNKYFFLLVVLLSINFLWSDIWINNIIKNPYFYFDVKSQSGLDSSIVQIISKSNIINLFVQPILKGALLGTGLKLLYDILRKLDN